MSRHFVKRQRGQAIRHRIPDPTVVAFCGPTTQLLVPVVHFRRRCLTVSLL